MWEEIVLIKDSYIAFLNGFMEIKFGVALALSLFYFSLIVQLIHTQIKLKRLKKDYEMLWDAHLFLVKTVYKKDSDSRDLDHMLKQNRELELAPAKI